MSILPSFLREQIEKQAEATGTIEIPKEYAIDFDTGELTGQIVEGVAALKVWIWNCLHTQRFRHPIYSWDYGADMEQYVGQGLTAEYLETELRDEIEEALKVNEYITGIEDYSCTHTGSTILVQFSVVTTLGNVQSSYELEV